MIHVNAMGDACPIPVVKTKQAIRDLKGPGTVVTEVDNEIAVQNLTKMARQKGYTVQSQQLGQHQYQVTMTIGEGAEAPETDSQESCPIPTPKTGTVVVVSSDQMGGGSEELGRALMKAFLYALGQQETLPDTILFYNGGVRFCCEGSPALEDLHSLQAQGVEILACGTCLNFYGLTEQLKVGEVTNMYVIVERMTGAARVVKP